MSYYPAWAKLNLGLHVGSKRPDGYHDIVSVMQTVSLADEIGLSPAPDISLEVIGADLPVDNRNLAFQAAELLRDRRETSCGAGITLIKGIPIGSGLAGGSADAAAVLYALNEHWGLKMGKEQLMRLGASLGSDVPFCLHGSTALVCGRGEVVSSLPPLPHCYFLLACPRISISSAWAYEQLDRSPGRDCRPQVAELVAGLFRGDLSQIGSGMANSFEPVITDRFPIIAELKHMLLREGAIAAAMSGSGPTVFGLFPSKGRALYAQTHLQSFVTTYLVQPVAAGAGRFAKRRIGRS